MELTLPWVEEWGGARTNANGKRVYNEKPVKQASKNISIKMLKNVGMTVPKSRETSAVYMQQDRDEGMQKNRRWGQYICSKTGDEGMQQ